MQRRESERQIRNRLAERRREKSTIVAPPNLIRDDETYTYDELLARVGLGEHWVRKAEREGLRTMLAGRVKLISGRDLVEFLREKCTKPEPAPAA